VSVKEGEKADIPDVLRNGMAKMVLDTAFLEQAAQLKEKVRAGWLLPCLLHEWMLDMTLLPSIQ
jgi:hypothetical protein